MGNPLEKQGFKKPKKVSHKRALSARSLPTKSEQKKAETRLYLG
jgi:hypothetical protein